MKFQEFYDRNDTDLWLRNRVGCVRREFWNNGKFHHDNASNHEVFIVSKLLTKMGMTTPTKPSYGPDLVPADFFLLGLKEFWMELGMEIFRQQK